MRGDVRAHWCWPVTGTCASCSYPTSAPPWPSTYTTRWAGHALVMTLPTSLPHVLRATWQRANPCPPTQNRDR